MHLPETALHGRNANFFHFLSFAIIVRNIFGIYIEHTYKMAPHITTITLTREQLIHFGINKDIL